MESYKVPVKWKQYNKLLDINPEDTWRIYLKNNPEEMYLLQINGTLILADVYNPTIINNDWIAEENRMPKADKERVIKRAKEDILDRIEQLAKRDGCPDSVLYFKTKYVDGKWTIAPKWLTHKVS